LKISILSDTHSFIDEQILQHLKDSDEIWHGGDVGNTAILDQLEQLTGRLRAVYGNIDGQKIRLRAPENELFTLEGKTILITHIAGKPPRYNPRVRNLIKEHHPDILVCGHSHILKVENDRQNNLLFINPGACGHHGFHRVRTIIQFELIEKKPKNMIVIELGRRGKLKA
jgi:putative phosphoesterase